MGDFQGLFLLYGNRKRYGVNRHGDLMVILDFRNCKTAEDVEKVFQKDGAPLRVLKKAVQKRRWN